MKLVQFGAGNIGRSFIGALFSRAGWDVVFIDTARDLVSLLNEKRYYTVVIKREGTADEHRLVGPVRAVDGREADTVAREIAACDMLATSVGKNALPHIMGPIAAGLQLRRARGGGPLDIIIAENVPGATGLFRAGIGAALRDTDFPLDSMLGLVETSIGKMVPLVSSADIAADPLRLFAEAYETLIVDGTAFHGGPPDIPGLRPVEHIAAWVDRKLFVHNLGHAATAYIGYQTDPRVPGISGALRLPGVEAAARAAMNASADALALEYPGSYTRAELAGHIDDLIARFGNSALGDTVFRVGRDRGRKLSRGDRVTGAMLLCARKGVGCAAIARVYRAALAWTAVGEDGKRSAADEVFDSEVLAGMSPDAVINSASALAAISGLAGSSAEERTVLETLRRVSAPQS